MYQKGRAWIELDKHCLEQNLFQIRRLLPSDCTLMAAVKANAYGHGAAACAGILEQTGVESFCVAALAEGIELRNAGIHGEILILGYTHPDQIEDVIRYNLTQAIVDSDHGRDLAAKLYGTGSTLKAHAAIDTGMHRLGTRCEDIREILSLWKYSHLNITGVFSHLCVSDSREEAYVEYTHKQAEGFRNVLDALKKAGITGVKAHLLSSYGMLNYPEYAFDAARIGLSLYGILSSPTDTTVLQPFLKPVLSLKTRIQSVRELMEGESAGYGLTYTAGSCRKIAALSIGYADGIPRSLSNTGYVLIHGRKAPVAGRICMDQMLVDVTRIPMAQAGDEAVLIGKSGQEEITAPVFAEWNHTISNEVLSRLGGRLERVVWESQRAALPEEGGQQQEVRAVKHSLGTGLRYVG